MVVQTTLPLVVGDKTYHFSPLTDADYQMLVALVQDRIIDVVKRNLSGLSEQQQATALDKAFARAASVTLTSPEAVTFMTSMDAAVYTVWLSLRKAHPDATLEDVYKLTQDASVLKKASNKLLQIEQMQLRAAGIDPKVATGATAKKRKTRVRRKRKQGKSTS